MAAPGYLGTALLQGNGLAIVRRRPSETLRRSAAALFGLILLLISAISGAQDNRKLIRKIDPIYPPLARQNNIEGAVKVEITIAPDGSVKQVRSLGGNPVLSQAVENAVKQWHYTSGPAETTQILILQFKL